jgi:hypothetical protein
MRLSDIMSQMGLASYAEVSLILFFATFIAIGLRAWRTSKDTAAEYARIPLDDSPRKSTNQT